MRIRYFRITRWCGGVCVNKQESAIILEHMEMANTICWPSKILFWMPNGKKIAIAMTISCETLVQWKMCSPVALFNIWFAFKRFLVQVILPKYNCFGRLNWKTWIMNRKAWFSNVLYCESLRSWFDWEVDFQQELWESRTSPTLPKTPYYRWNQLYYCHILWKKSVFDITHA